MVSLVKLYCMLMSFSKNEYNIMLKKRPCPRLQFFLGPEKKQDIVPQYSPH